MNRIITRREIIDLIYSKYNDSDPETQKAIISAKRKFLQIREEDFIEFANSNLAFRLYRLRKNTYYLC